jgi:signal transduction histidine kinase
MKVTRIKLYLFSTILALSVSSFISAYMLIDEILDSSISLGVNQKTSQLLSQYQNDLKKLRELDSQNEEGYKTRFYQVQEAMVVFQNPRQIKQVIKSSYISYFLIIFVSLLIMSALAAMILNRKVSNAYQKLLDRDIRKSKRLHELEYFDNWQQTAANLAHEIKNPLTPIEMMVTNLEYSYLNDHPDDFQNTLQTTRKVVVEEVTRLKKMVNYFSQFSTLPTPKLIPIDLITFIQELIGNSKLAWQHTSFGFEYPANIKDIVVSIDPQMFRQCCMNLLQNAVDANPELSPLKFELCLKISSKQQLEFTIANIGKTLSRVQQSNMFKIGYSSHKDIQNRGLGLAIVKKIVMEHDGYIELVPYSEGVALTISIPIKKVHYV